MSGRTPPVNLSGTGAGPAFPAASSRRAPLGGKKMCKPAPPSPKRPDAAKYLSGGGSFALVVIKIPAGGRGNAVGGVGRRANASNRIGAAALRPISPGTGAPSGLPTHTPMVWLPLKPTDQASRYP